MKRHSTWMLAGACALLGLGKSVQGGAAESKSCAADAHASYICGVQNVEDLVLIENTHWVLGGRLGKPPVGGGLYLIDSRSGAVTDFQANMQGTATAAYSACPGAPKPGRFAAHGINIRYGKGQQHELLAINHVDRESIEIFDLDVSKPTPTLRWKGCVIVPASVSPNSVAPVADGGFAVTSFGIRTDAKTYEKMATGEVSGFVAEWSPRAGWREVPGSLMAATNGIAVSPDSKHLFVTGWADSTLRILSRGEIPHTHETVALGGGRPDNIRDTPDGKLLITLQSGSVLDVFNCTSDPVCLVGFKVLRYDPASKKLETLLDEPKNPVFGGASAAIIVGNELWVGTFQGDRIARYKLAGK